MSGIQEMYESEEQAIERAKEIGGMVILSVRPDADFRTTPIDEWVYWVEDGFSMIRVWERRIWSVED